MFNHIWSVICQNSSIDSKSNTVSLFNCIENIGIDIDKNVNMENEIVLPIQFDIVSFWTLDDKTKKNGLTLKVEILNPKGKPVFQKEENIFTEIGWDKIRNIVKFSGLKLNINESGSYIFRISQKEDSQKDFVVVANLPVDIKINIK